MDSIVNYISVHPAVVTLLVVFVVLMFLYFILKQFIKLLLVGLVILMAAGGYYYFKEPDKTAERVKQSVDTVQAGTDEIAATWNSFCRDTKNLFDKGSKVPGDINKMLKAADEQAGK